MAGVNPRISILGLYNWDDSIFDGLSLPAGLDKNIVIRNLMIELSELQVLYPNPDFMKEAISLWSYTKQQQWQKLYDAMHEEYNPLWNKEAYYTDKETRDLHGSGESESINKVSAYNSEDFVDSAKGNTKGSSSDTGTITRERSEHGNIGVTTSQEMMRQEVDLWRDLNMTNIIVNDFKQRFCIMVY